MQHYVNPKWEWEGSLKHGLFFCDAHNLYMGRMGYGKRWILVKQRRIRGSHWKIIITERDMKKLISGTNLRETVKII